jgi:hypothetical protein
MSWLRSRAGRVALVLFLAALVNLPLVHGAWLGHRLDEDGVTTDATVVEARSGLVVLRMPADVDPDESEFPVRLGGGAADRVEEGDTVRVRVLPEDPGTFEAEGQAGNDLLYGLVGFADVVLAGFLLLLLLRRSGPDTLRLVATADVERARPGAALEEQEDGGFVVVGEIAVIDDDGIELDLGDRTVRVDLAGHRNPVGYQQPARVRCRMPDSDR